MNDVRPNFPPEIQSPETPEATTPTTPHRHQQEIHFPETPEATPQVPAPAETDTNQPQDNTPVTTTGEVVSMDYATYGVESHFTNVTMVMVTDNNKNCYVTDKRDDGRYNTYSIDNNRNKTFSLEFSKYKFPPKIPDLTEQPVLTAPQAEVVVQPVLTAPPPPPPKNTTKVVSQHKTFNTFNKEAYLKKKAEKDAQDQAKIKERARNLTSEMGSKPSTNTKKQQPRTSADAKPKPFVPPSQKAGIRPTAAANHPKQFCVLNMSQVEAKKPTVLIIPKPAILEQPMNLHLMVCPPKVKEKKKPTAATKHKPFVPPAQKKTAVFNHPRAFSIYNSSEKEVNRPTVGVMPKPDFLKQPMNVHLMKPLPNQKVIEHKMTTAAAKPPKPRVCRPNLWLKDTTIYRADGRIVTNTTKLYLEDEQLKENVVLKTEKNTEEILDKEILDFLNDDNVVIRQQVLDDLTKNSLPMMIEEMTLSLIKPSYEMNTHDVSTPEMETPIITQPQELTNNIHCGAIVPNDKIDSFSDASHVTLDSPDLDKVSQPASMNMMEIKKMLYYRLI